MGALDQWTEVLALLEDKLAPLTSSHHPHSQPQRGDSDMPSHVWNEEVLLAHPSQSLALSSEGGEKSSKGVERGSSGGVGNAWSSSHTETPAIVRLESVSNLDQIVLMILKRFMNLVLVIYQLEDRKGVFFK